MGCSKVERSPEHVKTVGMQVNKDFVTEKFPEFTLSGMVDLTLQLGSLVAKSP